MQLAHEMQYSSQNDPLLVSYKPISMNSYLDEVDCDLKDMALGDKFAIFSCIDKNSGMTTLFGAG